MAQLPIHDVIPALKLALSEHNNLVLQAPPGAGKTTVVPLELLAEDWLGDKKILLLEPRRLAARGAAQRMAQSLNEPLGQRVGYRMRLDTKVSAQTRIEVITEGVLQRLLQQDPSLDDVGLLIFDEFHERSLDADLGLSLALYGREVFGDLRQAPLKILVMSATLDGDKVSSLLDSAPLISSEGKTYPVDVHYGEAYRFDDGFGRGGMAERVVATITKALSEQSGSALVFLPGQAEIRSVNALLTESLMGMGTESCSIDVIPLYGDLSLAEQRRAIEPPITGRRKVVLATSIAETSITIDGVRIIVDSGLSRLPQFNPATGVTRLTTRRVSRAAAEQRCGRAGRTEPGVCYRLWSAQQQDQLVAHHPPEIHQADLAPLLLQLLQWGIESPDELKWMDPPSTAHLQQARDLLQDLSAIEAENSSDRLTESGQAMAQLPVAPRLAKVLLEAASYDAVELGCDLAAILFERDVLRGQGADLSYRLDALRGERRVAANQRSLLKRIGQQSKQFRRMMKAITTKNATDVQHQSLSEAQLLALMLYRGYPDRLAVKKSERRYQLNNGRSVDFLEVDSLTKANWLVVPAVTSVQGRSSDHVQLAIEFPESLFTTALANELDRRLVVEWDDNEQRRVSEQRSYCGKLLVQSRTAQKVEPQLLRGAMLELIRSRGLALFSWPESLQQWLARVRLLRELDLQKGSTSEWPDLSDSWLLAHLEDWLSADLSAVRRLQDFKNLDLSTDLKALLHWPLPQQLEEQAPQKIQVPSGSQVSVDYSHQPPVLSVKLQEMFGCTTTPTIAGGRIALMLHLLSPARRPLQVTQDLAGFWQGSYNDVKKEMKGRYPKHPWPDNPLEHQATAKTKKRM